MKSRLMVFVILSLMLCAGNVSAEDIAFEFEQDQAEWAFMLKAKGAAQAGDDLTKIQIQDLEITNNPKHEKNKWIDYVGVGFAYLGNDGNWNIAQPGPKKMVNKILKPGEKFEFKGELGAEIEIARNKLRNYWVVLVLGTADGGTIYAHSRHNVFGDREPLSITTEEEYFEMLGELDLRNVLSGSTAENFKNGVFDELNAKSDKYLAEEKRTPGGTWYLSSVESGILQSLKGKDSGEWTKLEDQAKQWIAADPSKPSGYITYANTLIFYAWWYSKSNSALPDLMRKTVFDVYIKRAENFLLENKAIAAKDPRWYEAMFRVATAQRWDSERFTRLENEAFSKFPYYYQLYFVAFDYHSPVWNGSPEAINSFAKKAVRYTTAKDKSGMYARVYWYASQRYYGSKLFTESKVAWGKMSRGIDDVLAQYPDQWNINNFAYFSCLAGDAAKTGKLIAQIEPEPIVSVWQDREFFDRCKEWSASASVN